MGRVAQIPLWATRTRDPTLLRAHVKIRIKIHWLKHWLLKLFPQKCVKVGHGAVKYQILKRSCSLKDCKIFEKLNFSPLHTLDEIGMNNLMMQYLLELLEEYIFLPLYTFNTTVKNHFMNQESSFLYWNWTDFVKGKLCMSVMQGCK